jgi:hypothetical protein
MILNSHLLFERGISIDVVVHVLDIINLALTRSLGNLTMEISAPCPCSAADIPNRCTGTNAY